MRRLARGMLYLGTAAIVVGLGRFHAQFVGHYYFHSSQRLPWNLGFAGLLCVAAYGAGLPDVDRQRRVAVPAAIAATVATVGVFVIQGMAASQLLPHFVLVLGDLLTTLWFVLCARLAKSGRSRGEDRDRVVIVARRAEQAALEAEMARTLERPACLAACLLPEDARPVGSRSKPLIERVLSERGTVVVLDRVASLDQRLVDQAATLHEAGLRVRSLSVFYDEWLGKLPLSELERMSLMFDVGELHRLPYGRLKRLCDIGAGITGALVLALVTPFIVVGDLIGNRGPLFFHQRRVGRESRVFTIVKFRTMRGRSERGDWTAEGDPRITRFGLFLRRTHLDELPQVVNILRGDQSLVGPRPEQPQYVADLREKIPFYDIRHMVRPGLTGWAQVKYPYGASELDALEKLQYDCYYLRHQGIGLDLRIMGRTLRSVIRREGR